MRDVFFSAAIILAALVESPLALSLAKNYPGSPGYPSVAEWDALNKTLSDRLYQCPSQGNLTNACLQNQQPAYAVAARHARDISAALQFANAKNLRVSVLNTGHDFLARNAGVGSLAIWTHEIRGVELTDDWTPSNSPRPRRRRAADEKQAAVSIGAGELWETVQETVRAEGRAAASGADVTVGASGGWQQGGGHGPLSNQYGMGCDQALEFEVVSPKGDILIANEHSNPDLFWALRGGGGGTFGVVTRSTIKTYPKPTMNGVVISIVSKEIDNSKYLDAMSYFWAVMPNISDFGISGYPAMTSNAYSGDLRAPNKSLKEITEFFEPIAERMRQLGAFVSATPLSDTARSLLEIKDPMKDILALRYPADLAQHLPQSTIQLHPTAKPRRQLSGFLGSPLSPFLNPSPNPHNSHTSFAATMGMSSRLLARSALSESNIPAIRAMFESLFADGKTYIMLPYPNGGGQVARNRDLDVALNPAWRDAIIHQIVMVVGNREEEVIEAMRPLSVDDAAYLNEAWPFEKDFKRTFFGGEERYQRLLGVKRKFDPGNVMWCHVCVGAEAFVEREGKLWKEDGA
ncbi:FAD-binding domain-containing protein [Aulographum hederae CBS 113979]|uniref:FAD-binding domain-containing protein n=1 Tax=Aulographum hederae CBS 113979 TaxID=1176131 RepID=A0A6G1GV73_9PEZI|nr:FAD-binding domain-containing protein [Aulographum hederae CBS 113979]